MALLVTVVLLVVAAVAVGVVVLGGGEDRRAPADTDIAGPSTTVPPGWDPRVAPIAAWVADERSLDFVYPVEVAFLTPEEYTEAAVGAGTDPADGEDLAAELAETVALLRALGLLHGEVDLDEQFETLMGEGSLAFYTPEEEKVYVRGTELTPSVRATLAHELTHVLQDQHFDLGRLADPDFERADSLRAMAEGDAGRIEATYVRDQLSDDERDAYQDENTAVLGESEELLTRVAPALTALFTAPYLLGEGFVTYLEVFEGGGINDVLDDALRDPPPEQELLDPSVRGTGRAEEVPVEVEPPPGAEVIDEGPFGPITWFLLLSARGDGPEALMTLDGWGGDAFASYRQDGTVCVVAAVAGDDAAATDLLHIRLMAWAEADPAGGAEVRRDDHQVELRSCDPGAGAEPVGQVDPQVLVLPPARAGIFGTMEDQGFSPEQATCVANRLIATFSVEELLQGDPMAIPDFQRRSQEVMRDCT